MATEKFMKGMKKAGSMLTGESGILNTLAGEHGEVSALMKKVIAAGDDLDERRETYPVIREKVMVHARCEEAVFYPVCLDNERTHSIAVAAEDDHEEVDRLIGELDAMPIDAPAWMERFEMLQAEIESHVQREEGELFELCQEVFDKELLRDLDTQFKDQKKEIEGTIGAYSPPTTPPQRPVA